MKLACTGYTVTREPMKSPMVEARFIIRLKTRDTEETALALKRLDELLSGEIDIVQNSGGCRCSYCGSKNDEVPNCVNCGAVL